MRHVSVVVAKDQLPNLLAYAGSKKLFHLTEVEDTGMPEGSEHYDSIELLAKASTVKNRITALISNLQIGDIPPATISAPSNNLEQLASFLDDETAKLERGVRQLEDEQGKLQTAKEQSSELSRFLSGRENDGVSVDVVAGG